MRFMREDEALRTMSIFEGASEKRRISKSSLKNWVVRTKTRNDFSYKNNMYTYMTMVVYITYCFS